MPAAVCKAAELSSLCAALQARHPGSLPMHRAATRTSLSSATVCCSMVGSRARWSGREARGAMWQFRQREQEVRQSQPVTGGSPERRKQGRNVLPSPVAAWIGGHTQQGGCQPSRAQAAAEQAGRWPRGWQAAARRSAPGLGGGAAAGQPAAQYSRQPLASSRSALPSTVWVMPSW